MCERGVEKGNGKIIMLVKERERERGRKRAS